MDQTILENFQNPRWRLENLYKIKTKNGTVSNLIPTRAQAKFLEDETQYNVILKARQLGFSTLCLIRLLDKALFTPNTTCVVQAHTREGVTKLFKIIKFAYDNYPKKYPKAKAKYNTKTDLQFEEINSSIYVATSVRGDTVDHLHISEMGFMENAEEKFVATSAAVTPRGSITIESTANGVGDFFYDFYNVAEEKGFKPHFYPWFMADEYVREPIGFEPDTLQLAIQEKYSLSDEQLAWYSHMSKLVGEKFKQEYPMNPQEAFIAAGGNVFPVEELDQLPMKKPLVQSGGMFVWAHPQYRHSYCMGVDTSEGINKDESAIDIIDLTTGEQVWHWSGKCPVPLLAEKVETYAKKYNNAYLIPEANNHGFALIYLLKDKKLNIYKREKFDGPTAKRIDRLGWQTTRRTKPLMIQAITTAIYEKDIKINHKKTIAQMKTFVTNPESGKMQAAYGKLDDCVISLALAWQGIRTNVNAPREAINTFDFKRGDSSSMNSY